MKIDLMLNQTSLNPKLSISPIHSCATFQALPMATAAMQATQMIGRPECNVVLAECAVYLARAKKNPEVYSAMNACLKSIQECEGNLPAVPLHLRNASTRLMRDLGYGKGYSYNATERERLSVTYMPGEMETVDFFAKSK